MTAKILTNRISCAMTLLSMLMLCGLSGCRSNSACGTCNGYQQPLTQPGFQLPQPQQYQVPPQGYQVPQQQFQVPPQQYQVPQGFQGSQTRNTLIPPPATGTLNIPSLARNPFSNASTGSTSGLLNTRSSAPTPASSNSSTIRNFNQQNGWRPTNDNQSNNNNSSQPSNSGSANATSVLASTSVGTPVRTASATTSSSYVESPNYRSTSANETNDPTRLPINNASNVRSPSQTQLAGVTQQPYYTPGPIQNQQYVGNFGTQTPGGYVPGYAVPNYTSAPAVLAQATTTYDPYAGQSRQADWRDREPDSGSYR